MEQNNNHQPSRLMLAGAIVVIAVVFAAGLWIAVHFRGNNSGAGADGGASSTAALSDAAPLAVQASPGGGEIVSDAAYGYQFAAPPDWYVEQDRGAGIAVYPDHSSAAASSSAACKIELSLFPAPAAGVSDGAWLGAHLAEDPTLAVQENSSEARTISDDPAIVWNGAIDGASTTLVYVFAPDYVYEIAPSALDGSPDPAPCAPYLDVFLGNLTL